jgi:hypothetical protein
MRLIFVVWIASLAAAAAQEKVHPLPSSSAQESRGFSYLLAQSRATMAKLDSASRTPIPPPADGVTDLHFSELFGPIGDRGLEYSERVRSLVGKRVRVIGFMIRESERPRGQFRLSGWPIAVESTGLCQVDDTPATVVDVIAPARADTPFAWRPGRLTIEGTLEIGALTDGSGRNSFIRVRLDPVDLAVLLHPQGEPARPSH